jgi:hypothetical protein
MFYGVFTRTNNKEKIRGLLLDQENRNFIKVTYKWAKEAKAFVADRPF